MNYEKLTVERFAARLKDGGYKGLTGARRAIGKTDWSKKDKEEAHRLADKHFSNGGAAKSSTKKASTKRAPKKAAKVAPKKATAPSPKVEAVTAPAPKRDYAKVGFVPRDVVPSSPPILEEVTRQNSASAVISAFRNSGPLNRLEQRAYDIATAEYAENASLAARRIVDTARHGIPTPGPLKSDGNEVVTAPSGGALRVPVPNGPDPELTADERAQLERLEKGAAVVPAIIGHG